MTVHLVRHGETKSYDSDAGLTESGVTQATQRGMALSAALPDGAIVDIGYAPTERTRETAAIMSEVLLKDSRLRVGDCVQMPEFRNLQVRVDGVEYEPTQVRSLVDKVGRSGWAVEARRFWAAHENGDAMGFWLATPLLWHESPAEVISRFLTAAAAWPPDRHLVVATHSACLRALVAWSWGRDPGEPENADVVTLDAAAGWADIGYGDVTVNLEIPNGPARYVV